MAKAAAYWEVANYREAYDLFACTGILFNHESPLRPERYVTRKIISSAVRIAAGKQRVAAGIQRVATGIQRVATGKQRVAAGKQRDAATRDVSGIL